MAWRYSQPQRCDFDSDEEYESGLSYYEDAQDDYAEQYFENSKY